MGLLVRLLQRCPEGIVADPFMGSGTTLVAEVRRLQAIEEAAWALVEMGCYVPDETDRAHLEALEQALRGADPERARLALPRA